MNVIKCPHCGAVVACPACNAPLTTKKAVSLAITNGYNFCGKCGKEIASTLSEALANSIDAERRAGEMDEKQEQIIDAVYDAILDAAEKYKAGKQIDVAGLQALYDGIRIMHHIDMIKNSLHQ